MLSRSETKFFVVIFQLAAALAITTFLELPGGRMIVNYDIPITEVPWQISLRYYRSHVCGGSIISEKYVVTAAHCTFGTPVSRLSVYAGSDTLSKGGQRIKIRKIHQNPQYNNYTCDFDISILELKTPLIFSDSVASIELPEKGEIWPDGTEVLVTGWGTANEYVKTHYDALQGVTVNLVGQEACKEAYSDISVITDRMICAGVPGGGKDSCKDDSGGPLVVGKVLAGIVSWGEGCGRPEYPGVYANVPALRDFIKDITGL